MKKTFTRFFAALMLLAIFTPSFTAWATDVTFNYSDYKGNGTQSTGSEYTMVKTDVSITDSKFYCASNASYAQFYAGGVTTIAPESGVTITKIVLTASSSSYNGFQSSGTVTPSTGSVSANGTAVTWTGSADAAFTISHNKQIRWTSIVVTYSTSGSSTTPTTVTIDDTNLTNTDVYTSTAAGSLSATVTANNTPVSGATVTWASSNTGVATIDANGVVTLVAAGTTTITASYAGNETYDSSSTTYSLTVTDSTPFDGVIFDATEDTGTSSITKDNVTLACDNGVLNNGSEYRLYKNSTTTISITGGNKITKIEFIGTSSNPASGFGSQTGWSTSGYNGVWEGEAESVSFVASGAQVRATMIKVTVLEITTPSISADDVNIAYDATSGEIAFTLNNPATNGSLSVSENVDWISNAVLNTTESKVTFTTTANEVTTAREGIITITYTYGSETVSKDVTVTQAAAPLVYTTIPALFNAATATATDVNVTFGGWVISAVKGSNAYLTDNQGNGLIIYASDHGFQVNDVLTGTASCKLQTYRGSAELTNLTSSTEGLTVTSNGTVTEQTIAISALTGVNTGALLAYQSLTYNGTALVDGNDNTITPYSTLYSYTFENGKTYNVKGIYLQYNNTKEILPRRAEDIEEVVTPTQDYDLTVEPFENLELITLVDDEMVLEEDGTVQVTNGSQVMLSIVADEGYVIATLMVNGVDHAGDIADDYTYTFEMPAEDVTISATAVEAPTPTGDKYVKVTSTTDLTDGQYLIVYEDGGVAFDGSLETLDIASNTIVVTISNNEIAATDATAESEFTINVTEGTIKSASGYYIGRTTDANGMLTDETEAYTNTISINEDGNADILASGGAYLRYNPNSGQTRFRYFKSSSYTNQKAIQLYKKVETPTPQTFTLDIDQYTSGQNNGWYLIASPVSVDIESNTMISGTYDLYRFNPTATGAEWENYKNTEHSDFTTLEVGRGYLYANGNNGGIQLSFTGTPADNGEVTTAYNGWNLIGNPLSTAAIVDKDYYRMNDTRTGIMTTSSSDNVALMEGIFVQAEEGETVTFTAASKGERSNSTESVVLNIMQDGKVIDRAIVRFNNDRQMLKFQLFQSSTKIYFPMEDADYAIVSSNGQGNMPVNFKAARTGEYTLSVETEGIDMNYMHIIDRLTGEDINVLLDNEYSFIASQSDVADRFILSFNENGYNAEANETFAFQNGSDVIVNGNGTLQVFDVTGRMVMNTQVNGVQTVNMPNGVYVFRMIGETVNTQKIVVR